MGLPVGTVLYRIFRSCKSCGRSRAAEGTKRFQGDVLQEEFQFASSYCLSSYYSVFVVRVAIMALLAILIGMLTILTWHITKVYTAKSLNSLAYGLRYELLQRPLLRMWSLLNSTVEITTAQVKLSEYVIRRYTSQPITRAQQVELYDVMRDVTWALFASHKALNAITVNYKNGFVQAFHRDHRSNGTFYIYSDLVNYSISNSYEMNTISSHQRWNDQSVQGNLSAIWYRVPLDPVSGEKIGKRQTIPPDDLINIAGPSQVPDGVASWHVAVSKFTDSPFLSAALPVWDRSNTSIVAVVGATTALFSVGQLMKELVEFHRGHIYLTSQEGYLLMTSTNAPLLRNSTAGPKLVMAVESEDNVIREGAQWLQRAYPNKFPPSHEVHVENARLGNKRCYIDSFFLNLKRLPMVGVIIIPREYLMGKVDERALKTLIILISASVCILFIGCVCILILTNGVSKEMKLRAELISQLEARRRAEASSNYKSQFLANMSHELRTPMAAVIGLLDILLCDDCLTNEQYGTVTQIRKCSTALLRLLNNILDLSKVESGKLVLEEAEFDLGRELEGLMDMFSAQCINHNLETILDLSDDMPKLVRGDSSRVVQIFANLISNSIKFTTSGHIVLRGWCNKSNVHSGMGRTLHNQKECTSANAPKSKEQAAIANITRRKDNKMAFWFEVDDTGCGIDPSKWESVFESFEQADPSTSRTHGGTGLGLCIVRTLVNKMGGDIKVIKKNGPGTLIQLHLLLSPSMKGDAEQQRQHSLTQFSHNSLVVILALSGSVGRSILSQWLYEKGVSTWQVADWNELIHILDPLFQVRSSFEKDTIDDHQSASELLSKKASRVGIGISVFIVVVDVVLLDLTTSIWKEQLKCLGKYCGRAKFAWILNHNTSNSVKMELRRNGHLLMMNRPLYKTKVVQILEAAIKEKDNLEEQKVGASPSAGVHQHECIEINSFHYDGESSDDSDGAERCRFEKKKRNRTRKPTISQFTVVNNLAKFTEEYLQNNQHDTRAAKCSSSHDRGVSTETELACKNSRCGEEYETGSCPEERNDMYLSQGKGQRSLEGLRILLAEDTPVLQRVAAIMLEKMGAIVIVVGDGLQAVNALNFCKNAEVSRAASPLISEIASHPQISDASSFDLVLMDCQMPKMDGYEATKVIRKAELGTGSHIPIVALTAHAMSSDEAKCLEVGMDAYLTKPIDCKLMVSTILSLTRRMSQFSFATASMKS
ncbi:hypothetical protein Nepgr_008397 [Nepenthes gracilis]|uniref:histidine kinase n=1 Tax=Nepenthes gracilis TaxID=150966 RepID=A0AAD3S9F5_NEPGR|nr:hypothetical protein Nepgr_008397 [Nepenthes gracilis]